MWISFGKAVCYTIYIDPNAVQIPTDTDFKWLLNKEVFSVPIRCKKYNFKCWLLSVLL